MWGVHTDIELVFVGFRMSRAGQAMSVRSCGRVCVHEPRLRFAVERQTFQLNWCFTGNSNSATLTTDHWSSSAGLLTEEEEVKMKRLVLSLILLTTASSTGLAQESEARKPAPKPLRALLIAGGCCHDYAAQQKAICEGIQARAYVRVDVYWTDNSSTAPVFPLYKRLNWAEEYDVIIHDECAAAVKDQAMVNRIIKVHEKIPAVHLHCAMHSFRTGGDAWFKHLGLQSSSHGPQKPIDIQFTRPSHPITETLKNWTTINEELYNNVRVLGAKPLAIGKQKLGGANSRVNEAIVAWVNESAGARSFSTTIGHNTETVQDSRYLDLVTRGLLWACGKLEPQLFAALSRREQPRLCRQNQSAKCSDERPRSAPERFDVGQNDCFEYAKRTPDIRRNRWKDEYALVRRRRRLPSVINIRI